MLRLAPGVVLQNEGGNGHPQQILMRGFDAGEGQEIEFTVDGIPLNEPGNPHGDGLTDLHFILPELVSRVRVVQGPFAPQQGNFAVAGSVHFDLGVQDPGLTVSTTLGSFGTSRILAMWRPGQNEHTFAAADLGSTDGFGQNRASTHATAIGGYELPVGKTGTLRFLSVAYATQYQQPGPVRADDVAAGRIGFYDTYDPTQGGSSSRFLLGATFADKVGSVNVSQSAFAGYRDFRVRANETGFLEDPRGDLLDQHAGTLTAGARGSARKSTTVLGLKQELELGYFARLDRVDSTIERDLFRTTTPYQTDSDLASTLSNLGVYADTSLKPVRWLTLRGGVRGEFFGFDIRDQLPSANAPQGQTHSVASGVLEPRGSLLIGPFCGFAFNLSAGIGARSMGPQDVIANADAPYAKVAGYEAGVSYRRPFGAVDFTARSVFFTTHVDHDLIFSEVAGRDVVGGGTTRSGWTGSARATGRFFDLGGSVAVVRATFDDTGDKLLYVPPVSVRVDGALFAESPFKVLRSKITGTVGLGATYVASRPLPNGDAADAYGLVDLGGTLKWKLFTLGVRLTNLLGAEYKTNEFNYASSFGTTAAPSAPVRHFVAGEPRGVFATLSVNFGS